MQIFTDAQEPFLEQAEKELIQGKKVTQWMWFIFSQLRGLGESETSRYYGLVDLGYAKNYRMHPLLGSRLITYVKIMLKNKTNKSIKILGEIDSLSVNLFLLFSTLLLMEPFTNQFLS